MNWGESTFPKATKTTTDPAQAATSRPADAGPRAKSAHTATSAAAWSTVCTVARASGSEPERFWEPCVETTVGS